jgi:hypothetical protein
MASPANDDDAPRARPPATPGRSGRALTIALGAMFVVTLIILGRGPRRTPHPAAPSSAPPPLETASGKLPPEERLERAIADLRALPELDDQEAREVLSAMASAGPNDAGLLLADGAVPPPLPPSAPKSVRFGVVVVRYRGAQLAPPEAPTRGEAIARARMLREMAAKDFATAVKAGDAGSANDIGTVRRGDLEPGIEYELFSLPKGGLSEVIDAPRGFWIMRRID